MQQVLKRRAGTILAYSIFCVLILPVFVCAQTPAGLPNPTAGSGVHSLQQLIIRIAEAIRDLGVPVLVFVLVSMGFQGVVMRGGKPEDRKNWLVATGWVGACGLLMLAAPFIARVLYNTCKQLGGCP